MGVIDAFVCAHNHHRRNMDNPGNFWDCMKGRIRFMTAITPAYVDAYWLICLTTHIPVVQVRNFVCRLPKPDIRIFPTSVPRHATKAKISKDGPSTLTGVTRLADGETLAWMGCDRKISPSKNRCHVWASYHDRSSSGIRRCQSPLQQHR